MLDPSLVEAVSQIGQERVMFSVDYPQELMDMGGRWFRRPGSWIRSQVQASP